MSTRHAGLTRFMAPLASTGGTLSGGRKIPQWRLRTCPTCAAGPQERCFRWMNERCTTSGGTFQAEGRKHYLKHPHPARKRETNDE